MSFSLHNSEEQAQERTRGSQSTNIPGSHSLITNRQALENFGFSVAVREAMDATGSPKPAFRLPMDPGAYSVHENNLEKYVPEFNHYMPDSPLNCRFLRDEKITWWCRPVMLATQEA